MIAGNYIIMDVETGGLSPKEHSLLSVGMVFVKDGAVIVEKEWKIKNDVYKVTPGALAINKINLVEHEKDAITIAQFWTAFTQTYDIVFGKYAYQHAKPEVIGKNVSFDIGFIHEAVSKHTWETLVSYRNIDLTGIARILASTGVIQVEKVGLDELLTYFQIEDPKQERHSALWDARATWEIYAKMHAMLKGDK